MTQQPFKHYHCARDHGEGILLVDIETETVPCIDESGNWQYYCMRGQHIFSITTRSTGPLPEVEAEELETFYRRR